MLAPTSQTGSANRHENPAAPGLDSTRPLTADEVWATLDDGLLVLAPDWRLRFVNAFAAATIGRDAADLVGRDYWELFPALVGTPLEREFRQAMADGRRRTFEHRSAVSGRWFAVKLRASPLGLIVQFQEITEEKLARQADELTTERFRVAANNPWLTLYEQDVELRYTWLYPAHPEHQQALGRTDQELFPGGELAALIAAKTEVMRTGVPARREAHVVVAGQPHVYDTYICARRDPAGRVIGVAGAALDVTDRKQVEEALRQSEDRLRASYHSAPIGIAEADLEGRITSVNARYAAQLGYAPEELRGRLLGDLCHPDDRAESEADYQQLVAGAPVRVRERRYRHKDGHYLWISCSRSVIRGADGRPQFGIAVVEDITERRFALEQREQLYRLVAAVNRAATLEEVYEAALDALAQSQGCARGAILLADHGGVMRFVASRGLSDPYRHAVEGHSPWRPDETAAQPICIENVALATLEPHLRRALDEDGIRAVAFIPLLVGSRLIGKFMVYCDAPRVFTAEQVRMAETIARQVGFGVERRRTAEHLEELVRQRTASLHEAVQQMEEFSYTVSHDLRAPIRGMLTFARIILDDHVVTPEVEELLNRIVRNASRMDALVRDTLAYSRVARGELQLGPVLLDDIVATAVAEAANPGAITVHGPLGVVRANESLLIQVFANLLGNALKFVAPGVGPAVAVSAQRQPSAVRVLVRDNGIGVPPGQHARIFAMFERLNPQSQYEGTGIGLAIVRKAVERMGGHVGVESDGRHGSTFWIELPAG